MLGLEQGWGRRPQGQVLPAGQLGVPELEMTASRRRRLPDSAIKMSSNPNPVAAGWPATGSLPARPAVADIGVGLEAYIGKSAQLATEK